MNAAPAIETERLLLRGHRLADYPACVAMWSDPAVIEHIFTAPSTPQQTWMRMLGYAGHWTFEHFGYWAVEEKATGEYVGELGFADFKRETIAPMRGVPEAGWAFVRRVHGRGYATEAVRRIATWADGMNWPRTVCMIDTGNAASINVAEKCEYRAFERAEPGGRPTIYFERLRAG